MQTFSLSAEKAHDQREWLLIDAQGQTLGRLASRIARLLQGKHKSTYSPNVDNGDYVVIINCEKIVVTGNKLQDKYYHRHSGYPSGLTSILLQDQLKKFPERVISSAVKGMVPKTRLGRTQMQKLKVYAGEKHPHESQKPRTVKF